MIDIDLIESANNNISMKNCIKSLVLNNFIETKRKHLLWHILHSFSVMYPENPTEDEKIMTKNFIMSIKTNIKIGCSSCGNKDTFAENSDIDTVVNSKINLIQFFCNYHKTVNTKYRQTIQPYNLDIYTTDFIIDRYTNNDYISFIETKYTVNLYKLFQNHTMDNFFSNFDINITKKITSENDKYDFDINFKALQPNPLPI
jgi:hypothetical protein